MHMVTSRSPPPSQQPVSQVQVAFVHFKFMFIQHVARRRLYLYPQYMNTHAAFMYSCKSTVQHTVVRRSEGEDVCGHKMLFGTSACLVVTTEINNTDKQIVKQKLDMNQTV